MIYELRKCQVRIDSDAATVMMVSSIADGKIQNLKMRINEFICHDYSNNHIHQGR